MEVGVAASAVASGLVPTQQLRGATKVAALRVHPFPTKELVQVRGKRLSVSRRTSWRVCAQLASDSKQEPSTSTSTQVPSTSKCVLVVGATGGVGELILSALSESVQSLQFHAELGLMRSLIFQCKSPLSKFWNESLQIVSPAPEGQFQWIIIGLSSDHRVSLR